MDGAMHPRELKCYSCAARGTEARAEFFVVSLDKKLLPVCPNCGSLVSSPRSKMARVSLDDGMDEFRVQEVMAS